MRTAVINYIVAILFVLIELRTCTIPDYIHVCQHGDPDLGGCIKESIETLRPRLITGIPELNVPPLEPFTIDHLSFNTTSEGTYLTTNVTSPQLIGASDFKILKITPTLSAKKAKFQFEVIIPQLHIDGNYEIDTKILLLQLKGKGPFHANITDYHFVCTLKGHQVQRDNVNHLEFDKMKCDCKIDKISIYLENLFDGNSLLEKATNDLINDNAHGFYEEIKPGLLKAVQNKFLDIANKIVYPFTREELFP